MTTQRSLKGIIVSEKSQTQKADPAKSHLDAESRKVKLRSREENSQQGLRGWGHGRVGQRLQTCS